LEHVLGSVRVTIYKVGLYGAAWETSAGKGGLDMDWRHQSACRYEDPELFFPVGNTGPAITQIEEAKKVCHRCIVKDACLAWALESGQDAGVWGGLSEDERRALKRRAARNRARMMEQNQNNF
jgi:WhiB family redox-sensing transcriptional regulator